MLRHSLSNGEMSGTMLESQSYPQARGWPPVTLELHDVEKQIKYSSRAQTPSDVWHWHCVGAKPPG